MACDAIAILDRNPSLTTEFKYGVRKSIPFRDLYCQTPYKEIVRFEELVITALAWQDVLYGDLIYRFLPTDAPPFPDHDLPGNNRILDGLVKKFRKRYGLMSSEFIGGRYGSDGHVEFSKPLITRFRGYPENPLNQKSQQISQNLPTPKNGVCKLFPLEIGYCRPDQMEWHLGLSRCVARFPYGHNVIVFFEKLRPSRNEA